MAQSRLWIVVLVGLLVVSSFALFTVHEREKAILFQLGRIVSADYKPGLHGKIPFIQNVRKFDARVQTLDAMPALFLTSEKKNVLVDSFVKWRINDVVTFYKAIGGRVSDANLRLTVLVQKGLKDEFGKRTIQEVVSGERADIMSILSESAGKAAADFGIEIVDVRIKRIDLPEEVSTAVYQRMQAERERVARDLRSKGAEEAKRIRANAERDREVLLAEAERDAQYTRGEGDAVAARVYAEAYGQDKDFFKLYRSLNAYKETFRDRRDVLLLEPGSEFFQFFNDSGGRPLGGNP